MKLSKKLLSIILSVVMLVSVMPMSAISAYATTHTGEVTYSTVKAGDIILRGTKLTTSAFAFYVNGTRYKRTSPYTATTCLQVTSASTEKYGDSSLYTIVATNACAKTKLGTKVSDATCTSAAIYNYKCSRCDADMGAGEYGFSQGHSFTKQGALVSKATCTAPAVYKQQCIRCTETYGTMNVGSALGHSYTKQGSKVSDATVDSPAIYNKQCERCTATSGTMEVGDKLTSMKVSYTDPLTGEEVDLGSATNDNAKELIGSIMKRPMQKQSNIFLGWYDEKDKAIDKNATRFDMLTNIKANYVGIGAMERDINDDKMIPFYKAFGIAGVQIREDRTEEYYDEDDYFNHDELQGQTFGGLRFVASFSEQLKSVIENGNNVEYGFVMASTSNARKFADHYGVDYDKYEIKYNTGVNGGTADTDYRYVTNVVCSNNVDHRNFENNYRLFTAVIDYKDAEGLKNTEFVARAYVKYIDANGNTQIYYDDYDGTTIFGGCSVSYNQALAMSM